MTIVIYKVLAAPVLILLSSLAARRWGEFAGGVLAGLPTISGVASLFLALEQGLPFAAQAAFHSLYGVTVCCLLTLTYIWTAMRLPWFAALPASLIVYAIAGYCVRFLPDSLWLASFCALSGPPLVILLLPRTPGRLTAPPRQRPAWAVPAQMLCALLLVIFLTGYAQRLGTVWSGILLFFPVMVIILGCFAHATMGAWAARQIIKGLMTGFIGGTAFSVIIACLLGPLPLWPCYALATAAALGLSAAGTMAARAASGKGRRA